jgi:hypothetical protein
MPSKRFDYLVSISETAFQSMVVATIESYLVHGPTGKDQRRRNRREVYGLLWGYETANNGTRYINVELATMDLNADRRSFSVKPSKAIEVVNKTLPVYWPTLQFLGEMHSHPHHGGERDPWKRPNLSEGDRAAIEEGKEFAKTGCRVALVFTIMKLNKHGSRKPRYTYENEFEFLINDLRMSVTCWVCSPTKSKELRYLLPRDWRPKNDKEWKVRAWHENYRHLEKKRVWLNVPFHNLMERFGA